MEIKNKDISISFDYDGCLSREDVQEIAKDLIKRGFDVKVITSRMEDHKNQDLFRVVTQLGIKKVIFTNLEKKYLFTDNVDIHLDNDRKELFLIARSHDCFIVDVTVAGWEDSLNDKLKYLTIWH